MLEDRAIETKMDLSFVVKKGTKCGLLAIKKRILLTQRQKVEVKEMNKKRGVP